MAIEFFNTIMGRTFYEGTMPSLVRELRRLNDNLEKLVAAQAAAGRAKSHPTVCDECDFILEPSHKNIVSTQHAETCSLNPKNISRL